MAIQFVEGDPLLTRCQTLAIGHNRLGRIENTALSNALSQQFPVAFSSYSRQCKAQKQKAGDIFLWSQSTPRLLFLTVRDSSVGATRLRHVQNCFLTIARDYHYHGIESLAIAPLGDPDIWNDSRGLLVQYFESHTLSVIAYQRYLAESIADETI